MISSLSTYLPRTLRCSEFILWVSILMGTDRQRIIYLCALPCKLLATEFLLIELLTVSILYTCWLLIILSFMLCWFVWAEFVYLQFIFGLLNPGCILPWVYIWWCSVFGEFNPLVFVFAWWTNNYWWFIIFFGIFFKLRPYSLRTGIALLNFFYVEINARLFW